MQTHNLTYTNLQKERNTFRSYFKWKATDLFSNALRKISLMKISLMEFHTVHGRNYREGHSGDRNIQFILITTK